MPVARHWTVDVHLTDASNGQGPVTHAEARLRTHDVTRLRGHGVAHIHIGDRDVPEVGDELAIARALSDLAHQLLQAAASDIGEVTHDAVVSLVDWSPAATGS